MRGEPQCIALRNGLLFSTSHTIGGLPSHHPCSRLHGHNYEVEVILEANTLDDTGFVREYRELSALKELLELTVDGKHLNDVLGHDARRPKF